MFIILISGCLSSCFFLTDRNADDSDDSDGGNDADMAAAASAAGQAGVGRLPRSKRQDGDDASSGPSASQSTPSSMKKKSAKTPAEVSQWDLLRGFFSEETAFIFLPRFADSTCGYP